MRVPSTLTLPLTSADVDAIERIKNIDPSDPERAHGEADEALLQAVHPAVREAYEALEAQAVQLRGWWA